MNFVLLRAYDNYLYAHIVLSMLQDAGITCHLMDEMTITIDPLLSPALGGIKVMVAKEDVPQAEELIQAMEKAE